MLSNKVRNVSKQFSTQNDKKNVAIPCNDRKKNIAESHSISLSYSRCFCFEVLCSVTIN